MKKTLASLVALALCFAFSGSAFADTSQPVNVVKVGCHQNSDSCAVTITGANIGPTTTPNCDGTALRWHGEGNNGKNILSVFMAAMLSGKKVVVNVYDDRCLDGKPQVKWVTVED